MKTKVFISWSGERSKKVAGLVDRWLPKVIQAVKPFFSDRDIESGSPWLPELLNNLNGSDVGITCLTPDNLDSPWILFEAGAIAKQLDDHTPCAIPYLLALENEDVEFPFSAFQMRQATNREGEANKSDTLKMIETINRRVDESQRVDAPVLVEIFEALWPELAEGLEAIEKPDEAADIEPRGLSDIASETLDRVRSIERIFSTQGTLLTREGRNRQRETLGDQIRILTHLIVKIIHRWEERDENDSAGIIDDHHEIFANQQHLKNAIIEYNNLAFRGGYAQLDEESDDPFGLYGRDYPGTGTGTSSGP